MHTIRLESLLTRFIIEADMQRTENGKMYSRGLTSFLLFQREEKYSYIDPANDERLSGKRLNHFKKDLLLESKERVVSCENQWLSSGVAWLVGWLASVCLNE